MTLVVKLFSEEMKPIMRIRYSIPKNNEHANANFLNFFMKMFDLKMTDFEMFV
jgi:hypothetical protein